MHSSKFIQIRKERSVEQRLASIWLDACCELEIPCILIYQNHWTSYISLNLKFIPETLAERLNLQDLQEKLSLIQLKYTNSLSGYCQHKSAYHTFDAIPNALAGQVATEIFDTVIAAGFAETEMDFIKLEEQQLSA